MREIKFRAYDTRVKDRYGKPIETRMKYDMQCAYDDCDGANFQEVLDNPLFRIMQYTGLKDKNGKEIYEGDILKCSANDNIPSIVYWDKELLTCVINTYHATLRLSDVIDKNTEVIGNTYENPELYSIDFIN
jgi:uncharacterized phage protein (TIGR01671 family)